MPKLSSDELMRRYGHLFYIETCLYVTKSSGLRCVNCDKGFPGETKVRRLYIGSNWVAGTLGYVCRSFAACERRRKEQAGG